MPRRVRVPATDDLFRPTGVRDPAVEPVELAEVSALPITGPTAVPAPAPAAERRTSSGRVKHDEKMTVYVTADELLDIEHARLELRRSHGVAVDRGRIVRAAVAMALADLDSRGGESGLVQRLHQG